jgi:hypothetical protein
MERGSVGAFKFVPTWPDTAAFYRECGVPLPPIGQVPAFFTPPLGHDDPLLPAVTRFVAARPVVGVVGLARRFGLGRRRAGRLLEVLRAQRVCLGYPWHGVYRVNPHAWVALQDPPAGG